MVPHALEVWPRLNADLKRKVAGHMEPNDAAANLRLVDRDTAAALRGSHDTITLSRQQERDEGAPQAQQPWPGPAFVAHWGRPDPWRALTLPQRKRLLCLAASSGHAASLEAALAQCGCSIPPQALTAAAAAGNRPGCRTLLAADGASRSRAAAGAAAAAGGHLPVLYLLLNLLSCGDRSSIVSAAARGACAGGQAGVLTWLQQKYKCSMSGLAEEAARAGQVALLEGVLLPQLQAQLAAEIAEEGGGEEGQGGAAPLVGGGVGMEAAQRRWVCWQLLQAIAHGCPVEVLERHYDTLWMGGRARRAGQGQQQHQQQQQEPQHQQQEDQQQQQQQEEQPVPEEFAEEDQGRDDTLGQLLAAAAGSPTTCWASKLQLLFRKWGAVVARQVLGHGGSPGHLAVLRLLRERGHVFGAEEVAREAPHSSGAALTWLAEVAEDGARGEGEQEARRWWSDAWAAAARTGHGTAVLRALRRRGAAVRLDAVAVGGSVEALEWAVEELEAEPGYQAMWQALNPRQAREAAANTATLAWLRSRGLLQPE
ncbi:hypothetical protein HXX76_009600 [Chlamydomonas incerta]|uniref:Uncharacterized protein n=1 Tax=Chlamydomonas incerta TaxID=51695 RepID=A0A835VVN8_CHLIN|nr:hypothetical protein HXX76_009600 [Chlamydomonas incerta]|eukprot:KAG2431067.1 hypothetical protein HXX76_009600 [Chlamydomonas incerta]